MSFVRSEKVILKTAEEIEAIRESALFVSRTLAMLAAEIKEGTTTDYLDRRAEEFIRDGGGVPSFKGYQGYPSSICASVNEAVVHGIPNNKPLKNGDIVSVDCGIFYKGFHGDHAYTFPVGEVKPETLKLLVATKESLYAGIEQAKVGNRIGDVSHTIQKYCEARGYSVVRELVGHGLGRNLHERPDIPNWGKKGSGIAIENGMVLAIEPMINLGRRHVYQLRDRWTVVTSDLRPSAHYEHNIAIVEGNPVILSTFDYIQEVLGDRFI
jgi:methionyl aminopeptidase